MTPQSNVIAVSIVMVFACAGSPQASAQLDISGEQPLLLLSRQLTSNYGWVINFEDAPVAPGKHTVKVVDARGRSTVMAKTGRVSIAAEQFVRLADVDRRKLLQSAINQVNVADGAVHYGYSIVGDIARVYPIEIYSEAERAWHDFTPLLDTRVSFPQGKYQIAEVMHLVLSEVERIRGVRISIGTVSPNIAAKEVVEGAIDEPAGLVLDRAFSSVNTPLLKEGLDRLVFCSRLAYWPDSEMFFYNMNVAKVIEATPQSSEPLSTKPSVGGFLLGK